MITVKYANGEIHGYGDDAELAKTLVARLGLSALNDLRDRIDARVAAIRSENASEFPTPLETDLPSEVLLAIDEANGS